MVLGVTYNNIHELFISNHSANINKPNQTRCVYSYLMRAVKRGGRGGGEESGGYKHVTSKAPAPPPPSLALIGLGQGYSRSLSSLILRWLNTVFDTSVSFNFSYKILDPLVAKNGSKQVNNTNFNFLIIKLTYMPLPWQHD